MHTLIRYYMALTYSLALYSIIIHKRFEKEKRFVLTVFVGGQDLFDIALEMLTSIKYEKEQEKEIGKLAGKKDSKEKRFFRIMKGEDRDILNVRRPYLTGIIESGEYGTEENIVNVETGETGKKTKNDALLRPFYFMLYVPRGGKRAILLLERISNLGILTVFEKKLQEAVSRKIGDHEKEYTLSITPLLIDSVMKKHLANLGGAKKIILSQVKLGDITASKISGGVVNDEEIGGAELVFSAPKNKDINVLSWLDMLRDKLSLKKKNEKIFSGENIEYSNVKFAIEIGGALRTVSVQDIGKLGTYLDITDQVVLDSTNYPTFGSVDQQANILITDIKNKLEENEGQQ